MMSTGRSQRRCSQRTMARAQWSNKEKRRLIQALIHCHPSDIDGMMQYIPTRSKQEIITKIDCYKSSDSVAVCEDEKLKATHFNKTAVATGLSNMDSWLILLRKMISSFDVDLSYHMGQVCQVIAAMEDTDLPPDQAVIIRNIYTYLGDLLMGKTPIKRLNRVEAVLMGDLLESLQEACNEQKRPRGSAMGPYHSANEYLKWKFTLLNSVGTINHSDGDPRLKAALNNDWAGFMLNTCRNFRPRVADDPTMANTAPDGSYQPGILYTLNPFSIPHNLLQFNSDTDK